MSSKSDVLEAIQFYWECRLVCTVPSVYTTKQLNGLYKLIYQQTAVSDNYAYSAVTTYFKHCANKLLPKHLTCHVATSNDIVVLSPVKFDTTSNDHLYNTKHIPKIIKSLRRICLNNEANAAVKQATTAWKQFTLNQIYEDSQQW